MIKINQKADFSNHTIYVGIDVNPDAAVCVLRNRTVNGFGGHEPGRSMLVLCA